MTKKILLIIGILAIIGTALFFVLNEQKARNSNGVGFSFKNYFPFGNQTQTQNLPEETNTTDVDTTETNAGENIPKLRKLSKEPVVGSTIWNMGTTTLVRFVEKGTGNVYEARSDSLQIERLTNTTLPKIIKVFWVKNGSGFFSQTLVPENEIIETNFVSLVKKDLSESENLTPYTTKISKLPLNIRDLVISNDSKSILYYTITNNRSNFYISKLDGTDSKLIFSHPITEWLLRYWINNDSVLIQTKEGGGVMAYYYTLNITKKEITKTNNPISNIANKAWVEKCYLPVKNSFIYCAIPNNIINGDLKDNWYKGKVFTSDYITKTDPSSDSYYNILDPKIEAKQNMDIVDLMASEDESHLIFKNKLDSSLWIFRMVD